MGDISQGRQNSGYTSPESRRLEALDSRLSALEAEVERLRVYSEERAKAQQESTRRMMQALNGVLPEVPK